MMITQHDHANLSGQITENFNIKILNNDTYFDDLVTAAYEHDRGWIVMDETPFWNDQSNGPYSFTDFPMLIKLLCYKNGIDEVESVNNYAALLCSMHYADFFSDTVNKDCIRFKNLELKRQANIQDLLKPIDANLLFQHFRMIQFCDRLSLYICLNEPGISKVNEHERYKEGFINTEIFNHANKPIVASWMDNKRVNLDSFPFNSNFTCMLKYKAVPKIMIQHLGIANAYKQSEWREQEVIFCE